MMRQRAEHTDSLRRLTMLRFTDLVKLGIVTNRQTLRRWVAAGSFPAPILLGPNLLAWRAPEVEAWLEQKQADRGDLIRRWRGPAPEAA